MKYFHLVGVLLVLFFVGGCERQADVGSPVKYEKEHVRFFYPANWTVAEDAMTDSLRYVLVETPGDAIAIAQVYGNDTAISLEEFAKWFSNETSAGTSVGTFETSEFLEVNKKFDSGDKVGIRENFEISLLGVKVPHRREYFSIETDDKVVFLISQSPLEDLDKVEPGFDLLFGSFVVE